MARKKSEPSIAPPMPAVIHLDGGKHVWRRRVGGTPGYSSECHDYDILQGDGYRVLVSLAHDPNPGDEDVGCWRKRFRTIKEAMEHAEKM